MGTIPFSLVAVAALLALAGCIGAAPPASPLASPDGAVAAATEVVAEWTGRFTVGGGFEFPGHFPETAGLTAPVWPDQMRSFEVTEVPTALVFVLDWTGAPGSQLQLMVEGPGEEAGTINQWVDPAPRAFSAEAPLCVPVPAEDLRAGHWLAMPHSLASADVAFTVTARMTGGAGAFHEGHEGWAPLPEFLQANAEGRVMERTPEDCAP